MASGLAGAFSPSETLSGKAIADARARIRSTPLRPMEDLSGRQASAAETVAAAEDVLARGWFRNDFDGIDLAGPIPWDESAARSRSWSFHIHCWEPIDALLLAYSASQKAKYLTASLRVAEDWIDRFAAPGGGSPFAWYDMAVGLRATRLAFLAEAAAHSTAASDATVGRLLAAADRHAAWLADDRNIVFHNNHGFYEAAGQAALGKRFAFRPGMAEGYEQARRRLLVMLDQQFSTENVHKEHSPDYFRMVLRTLGTLIASGLLDDPPIVERYLACERALAWFIYPDGQIVNFGDSDARDMLLSKKGAARAWRTEEMRYIASAGRLGSRLPAEHAVFPDSGYFVVRSPFSAREPRLDSYLAVAAAYHSRTHKHADDLSLVWYERGARILIDAGRYGYVGQTKQNSILRKEGFWYADPKRIYVESTHAHNTVEIDRTSYPRRGKPYGSAIVRAGETDDVFFCEGHVRHFKTVRHARTVAYRPGAWLLVFDWLWDTGDAPRAYTQWWHFAEGATVSEGEGPGAFVAAVPGLADAVHVRTLLPDPVAATVEEGAVDPRLQGWQSPSEEVLRPQPALGLSPAAPLPHVSMVTLFTLGEAPSGATARAPASGRKLAVDWADPAGAHRLRLERPAAAGEPLTLAYRFRKGRPGEG